MCLYCYEKKHPNTTRELRAALNLSSRTYVPVPSPHRMQMQNAECRIGPKAVNCTRCRMQMQNAECRIGPKAGCLSTRCRMQDADAGCGIGLKAVSCTRRTNSLGLTDFASCILHPASCTMQKNPFWGRFCFLHPAFCMLHIQSKHFGLGSAFCILHLHSAFSEKYGM